MEWKGLPYWIKGLIIGGLIWFSVFAVIGSYALITGECPKLKCGFGAAFTMVFPVLGGIPAVIISIVIGWLWGRFRKESYC